MVGDPHSELQEPEQDVPAPLLDNNDDAHLARWYPVARCRLNDPMVSQEELPQAEKSLVRVRPNRVDSHDFQREVCNQFLGANDQK
jgi:hypothetical protein